MGVSGQQGHALVCEVVVRQIQLLQDAARLLRKCGCRKGFQFVGRRVQESQATRTKCNKIPLSQSSSRNPQETLFADGHLAYQKPGPETGLRRHQALAGTWTPGPAIHGEHNSCLHVKYKERNTFLWEHKGKGK